MTEIPELIKSMVELKDGSEQSADEFVVLVYQVSTSDLLRVQLVAVDLGQLGSECRDLEQQLLGRVRQLTLQLHHCRVLLIFQLLFQPFVLLSHQHHNELHVFT